MKLYTFLNEAGEIMAQVRADNHDEAVTKTGSWGSFQVDFNTDFYSEEIDQNE